MENERKISFFLFFFHILAFGVANWRIGSNFVASITFPLTLSLPVENAFWGFNFPEANITKSESATDTFKSADGGVPDPTVAFFYNSVIKVTMSINQF